MHGPEVATIIKELKIEVRTHFAVGQAHCPLCGQASRAAKTGAGLYDGGVHLGDVCAQCLRGGRHGASARTRSHSAELRKLADQVDNHVQNRQTERYLSWLFCYAAVLDDLASRLESMTEWIPRAT